MWHNSKTDREGDGHQRTVRNRTRGRAARAAIMLTGTAVLALACATPALASGGAPASAHHYNRPAVELVAVTPSAGDVAGAGGVFNVDLALLARNSIGNRELSAANGYTPGISTKPGIGQPDPFASGLVVLLSTTPQAAGGPDANLAGVFQLTDVASSHGLAQVFADWQVAKAGAFGAGTPTTLTAYLVNGTAPGIVTGSEQPISNVIMETFIIGG
jgi:hypothetical protein